MLGKVINSKTTAEIGRVVESKSAEVAKPAQYVPKKNPKKQNCLSKLYSKAVMAIKRKRFKNQLIDGIPKAMRKEAKEMVNNGVTYSRFTEKYIYKPQYSNRAVSLDGARSENIQLKLDLLAKYDKNLYIGQHTHPIHYIQGTKGYENFNFENFEECINQKLTEIAKGIK